MNKDKVLTRIIFILLVGMSCNSDRTNVPAINEEKGLPQHTKSRLSWVIDLGVSFMSTEGKNFNEQVRNDDTMIAQGTNIFQCIKLLNSNFNQVKPDSKKTKPAYFKLKQGSNNLNYIECQFGSSRNKYYLIPVFISDTAIVMISYERRMKNNTSTSINILNSIMYFKSTSKEVISITYNSFYFSGGADLSMDQLNTISILDEYLYETYMMYFYKKNLKFSLAISYNATNIRSDKLFIPDLNNDNIRHKNYNNCRYLLKDFGDVTSIYNQRSKYCGMAILTKEKNIIDFTPSWCVENRLY